MVVDSFSLQLQNPSLAHEVREAATPVHFRLLQSIGNLPDGIKQICDMRANLLRLMKTESDRSAVSALHRLEKSAHELLVIWFCQSNMKLERLMWQSPGDILHKVSEYEAVHPVRGPSDFKNRLGCGRREPLVIVHVALLNDIADNVQSIVDSETVDYDEDTCLSGIDLGNMLIKRVANLLHSELPSIKTHSTLSPIPGFRTWMLRRLRESSLFGKFKPVEVVEAVAGSYFCSSDGNKI
ncbi:unnamed protein product [Nippostrongylus brasiliensis]|uniref:Malonyl-CoA decarboxylase, mitochondrial (inferred by orthology to a human protein) n=1 Tax=Nippostrongylus brasiliensis TaxID=27835 RepID=A0A0N4XH12_NIPBR|nr:unnamed protein product [Nippostrongylus brasiliensis]